MTLAAGAILGPYEVVALVGAGGMGEVYKARDTRLNRDVAIKLLPAVFSNDPERLRRFETEACAAGQLNHPNIVAIYDVGVHEGSPYVVSELIEGDTLREILTRGPLPYRKTVDYARQMANGLAAAHDKGIVHRDLKPDNLIITKDGWIKILDFGLAKLMQREDGIEGDALTMTEATEPGAVLGTVGYMSPEQVRARPADHRADIFSFGAVLYEMLSGRRAFKGNSAVETLSAILQEDPPDLSQADLAISPAVERIVRHCLEKNPDERFQSARDLAFHLEAVSGLSNTSAGAPLAIEGKAGRRWWPWLGGLAVAIVLLAADFGGEWAGAVRRSAFPSRTASVTPAPPSFQQLTFRRGILRNARFAPDGSVLYGAAWDGKPMELFSTRPESPGSHSVLANADILAISSTGEMALLLNQRRVAAFVWVGTLARAPISGGAPRVVLEDVQTADWSPDGANLAVVRRIGGNSRLEFPVGKTLHETSGSIDWPRISPKGDAVAFFDRPEGLGNASILRVIDAAGKKHDLLGGLNIAWGLAWSADGSEIWFAADEKGINTAIHAINLQGRRRLILRAPGAVAIHDVSRNGRVLLSRPNFRVATRVLAPGETREQDLSWFNTSGAADLSNDGKTLLFAELEGERARSIYLRSTDGSPAVGLGDGFPLDLSPDGKFALVVPQSPVPQLLLLPTGPGGPRRIQNEAIQEYTAGEILPDGRRVVFAGKEAGHGTRLYVQDLEGGKPRPLAAEVGSGAALAGGFAVSPDGKSVLVIGSEEKLRLYPLPAANDANDAGDAGASREIPGLARGESLVRWNDQRTIFVYSPSDLPVKVFRVDVLSGRRQLARELAPIDPAGVVEINRVLMTPDGKSYAYSYWQNLSELYLVDGLK